jgi:hypothetical protein
VKESIREMLDRRQLGLPAIPAAAEVATTVAAYQEQFFTAAQVGRRLAIHPDTVRDLFRHEAHGVLRFGNRVSSRHKRAYTTERYSASAIERLIHRLEAGDDPRYSEAA